MYLDDNLQLDIVSNNLTPNNIKIYDNIINNSTVSDHTLIIFDIDRISTNIENNSTNKKEGFKDYIHIKIRQ